MEIQELEAKVRKYDKADKQLSELLSTEVQCSESVGRLDYHAGRLGVVCHFDNEGKFTGVDCSWVVATGLGYSQKDVAEVCNGICAIARFLEVGEGN